MNISKTVLALYQTIIGEKQKRLIKTVDAYLDINYGDKVYQIIDQVDEMVDKINEIINNQNK